MTPSLNELVLRDTPYAALMNKHIYNVLLIATNYDAFMLEDDGRVDEQIFNEYTELHLSTPPRFTQVTTEEEALAQLADRNFELVIVMPNMAGRDIFAAAGSIKERYPHIPIAVLTPFSKEVSRRVAGEDLSHIDYVFSWLGNSELLLAIVKLIEDKLNALDDLPSVGVQTILLVEDSVRFYSSALPHLYRVVLEQSREFAKEALNDHLKMLRMRGRPKIMLARTYEEALEILKTYPENILGVISDMSFTREGRKDPLAGWKLGKYLRSVSPHTPLILESSEEGNKRYADELGAAFIAKHSKSYPQDLRAEVMARFGFGDFIIDDPDTHQELLRIKDLKDLQTKVFQIPDKALYHHLSHNHFSRFFYSRAMFPPAEILKAHDVSQYADMDEARQFIFNLIVRYRQMKNAGVVAVYNKERFDEYSNFARIGNGSLGGKGRGLAFMGTMVKRYPRLGTEHFMVNIPKTVVICTDIFDEFMERNNLYPLALSDTSDKEILEGFEQATLPERLPDDLGNLLRVTHGPLAVRSSSLLEDSHYQPFAGVYSTYMIPRPKDPEATLRLVCSAIKAVYASVFYKDSKAYLTATQNLIDQEKMAIVLQEVVGAAYGGLFYPTLSGVARSLNFYPLNGERPEEGVVSVATGLGKHIVDGGTSLRLSPVRPRHIWQLSSPEIALRDTQRTFFALDLSHLTEDFTPDEAFNLRQLPLKDFPTDDTACRYIFSTYDLQNGRLTPGCPPPISVGNSHYGLRRVVSFDAILQSDAFPLANTVKRLLEIGEKEMGRPVEIEFAMQVTGSEAFFYLLQIRPIVDVSENVTAPPQTSAGKDFIPALCEDVLKGKNNPYGIAGLGEKTELLLSSQSVLGNGCITDVRDIIYIRTENFTPAHNREIAMELATLNAALPAESTGYVLIGPGRWGSSDPWLGIPVTWPQISKARIIAECGLPSYRPDPSQGTHFFQNLTSLGVGYFTLRPYAGDGFFNEAFLNTLPAVNESHYIRHIHLSRPLFILMDGRKQRGCVVMPLK